MLLLIRKVVSTIPVFTACDARTPEGRNQFYCERILLLGRGTVYMEDDAVICFH